MADTKISDLTAAGTITGTELVPVVQGGATKKAPVSALLASLNSILMGSFSTENGATIADGTYTIDAYIAGIFTSMRAATISGTATLTVKINGVNVTGWAAVGATTTPTSTAASAANVVALNDIVTITVSSSSGTGLRVSLRGTRS